MEKDIKDCIYMILDEVDNFKDLEKELFQLVCSVVREKLKEILKEIDDQIKECCDDSDIFNYHDTREREIKTLVGPVKIERGYYKDNQGSYHHLLDEYLNLPSDDRQSPGLKEAAIKLVQDNSYRDSAEKLEDLLNISTSHSAIHDWVQELGTKIKKENQEKVYNLFEHGLIPGSEEERPEVDHLFLEVDGVFINLQNEKKNRGELKLGLSYKGWERRHPSSDEFELSQKIYYGGVFESKEFWQQMTADLYDYYEFNKNSVSVLNGDGASWINTGSEYLPGFAARFLDSFHYSRKIIRKLGRSSYVPRIYDAIESGDKQALVDNLEEAKNYRREKKDKQKVEELKKYLLNYWEEIQNYQNRDALDLPEGMGGMGAIESNIDKVLANRLTKRGMRWSKDGAENLTQIILAERNNSLEEWFSSMNWEFQEAKINSKIKKAKEKNRDSSTAGKKEAASYQKALKATMPALEGPDAGKGWVKGLHELATSGTVI